MLEPGLKLHQGRPVGRDPREMSRDELMAADHEPMSALRALRAKCLDCCAQQPNEVALCAAVDCPSWPFRMGTDPWRQPASEARREAARRAMAGINTRRRERGRAGSPDSPSEDGATPSPAMGSGVGLTWATTRAEQPTETERHREGEYADPPSEDGRWGDAHHVITGADDGDGRGS
jgi:hypothetical protein